MSNFTIKILFKCLLLKILQAQNPNSKIAKFNSQITWVDQILHKENNIYFSHVGGIGDILFSLYFCKELAEYFNIGKINFFIITGKKGLPIDVAKFIKSLLENQSFINSVSIGENAPSNSIMLDEYRNLKINYSSGDIRSWYYNLTQVHLPKEFWLPIITAKPNYKYKEKIFFSLTERYQNVHLNYNYLKQFSQSMIFVGLPSEHISFCSKYFTIPYCRCENMLEMAEYIVGSKGFIGNQSGIYSLAECLKVPRILLAPDYINYHGVIIPGPHNNLPQGGWNEDVSTTEKMIKAMENLINLR